MTEPRICVGAFAGSYGVRGEVRLKSYCADPAAIETYGLLYTEDGEKSFIVGITRAIKNGFAARVEGIQTKEQADALNNTQLFVSRDVLPSLPDDEYYHSDLIGLTVLDTGGTEIGTVQSVQNHGASDLLEIAGPSLKASVLYPFTVAAVPTVDLAAGRIIVDPPEGIFSEPSDTEV
ncbi:MULTISPECIES: ribosome maturation factor RimM [Halocynthiibacter]|uniref:Ribosome maturation factor RimM n=1 Tax=Halocynthiibacter halioticoli TaxID=2986804 RepID=A0AAE3J284_9RHOB|nr:MULTISPECIES: ribosome maturation factor RimM [Halocynthiibacter]MCV6825455.1 ribosome maturation factor RimM [Halocynthiibacter halioticoli]MCW4058456.1 ribosome maturation factor RimM [Halocynthiibacter sp. SDUM655004]